MGQKFNGFTKFLKNFLGRGNPRPKLVVYVFAQVAVVMLEAAHLVPDPEAFFA